MSSVKHHGARDVPVRHLGLLHHIGQILKSDEGKEGQQTGEADAGQRMPTSSGGGCTSAATIGSSTCTAAAMIASRPPTSISVNRLASSTDSRMPHAATAPSAHDDGHHDQALRQVDELLRYSRPIRA